MDNMMFEKLDELFQKQEKLIKHVDELFDGFFGNPKEESKKDKESKENTNNFHDENLERFTSLSNCLNRRLCELLNESHGDDFYQVMFATKARLYCLLSVFLGPDGAFSVLEDTAQLAKFPDLNYSYEETHDLGLEKIYFDRPLSNLIRDLHCLVPLKETFKVNKKIGTNKESFCVEIEADIDNKLEAPFFRLTFGPSKRTQFAYPTIEYPISKNGERWDAYFFYKTSLERKCPIGHIIQEFYNFLSFNAHTFKKN